MINSLQDDTYITRRIQLINRFWRRLGGKPNLSGKNVLELGCGYGELSIDLVRSGANKVIGIDTDPKRIDFANRKLETQNFCYLKPNLKFLCCDIRNLNSDQIFDIIVSRDTMEHIIDIEEVVENIFFRLQQHGQFYIGFGPLYRSPYGGHTRMRMPIPWGHLLLPESILVFWVNCFRGKEEHIKSIYELGLNKLSLFDYENILKNAGFRTLYWKVNHCERFLSQMFSFLCRFSLLKELFAHDIYAILEKA